MLHTPQNLTKPPTPISIYPGAICLLLASGVPSILPTAVEDKRGDISEETRMYQAYVITN
jgi:hypothetical protein